LDAFKKTLEAAGLTMNDLVSVQIFCPDVSLFNEFNAVYRTYFTGDTFPARAFLGSGVLLFGDRFEVQGSLCAFENGSESIQQIREKSMVATSPIRFTAMSAAGKPATSLASRA